MSGFVKRSAKSVNPAGGVNPAQSPNVGQYGWTSFDASNVNQIIEYVNLCKQYADQAKDSADYVQGRFAELEEFMNFIETVYTELKPIIDQIQPIYQDIIFRHDDVTTRHLDVIKLHNEVTQDKIEINEIKANAIAEVLVVKQEMIAEATALKNTTIADVTVIKNLALAEADRAKTEADRAAAEANKATTSAGEAAASATKSEGEAGKAAQSAKDAADIAEELRKGQVYRGTWNIEANNSFPPKPDTNSVWDITLNESSTQFTFNGEIWYWGDRLLYLKDDDKFSQIESGSTVISVNGKGGAVTLDAKDVGALPITGGTLTGMLYPDGGLTMKNNFLRGTNDNILLRDHGNGNVTLSASTNAAGVAGELYLGYNGTASGTNGYNTLRVRLDSPLNWKNSHALVDANGLLNSEKLGGPIRTDMVAAGTNVWHTVVGGTDTVNRGRTLVAAGEAGKVIADNTNDEAEAVHIAGDQAEGVYIHSGVQNGWGGSTHQRYTFVNGDIRSQKMDGTTVNTFYHSGNLTNVNTLGGIRKEGDDNIGSLTLAADKVLNATLTHQKGYMSLYPYSTGYGLGGLSGNRCRLYYKEHNNGKPDDLSRGLVINSHDADGTSHPMDIWLGGNKVYHAGNKPTAADVGALPITGGNLTGMLRIDHGDYSHRMVLSGDMTYYQGGHETDRANQKLALSGFNGYGLTTARFVMSDGVGPTVAWGSTVHKIYHEGFKPAIADLLGDGATTSKAYTFSKPTGVEDGKYYPVLFTNTNNYPEIMITTASSGASHSMNNCSFKGRVLSGGWSDKGKYVTGDFVQYTTGERAIHSIVGASESDNHFVVYIEARAFPIVVTANSAVEVSSTGKDVIFGTTTYKAGISDMTASGDYGTKTSLLMNFSRGSGFYTSQSSRLGYIDAVGGINATSRVNVFDYNDNGAFITRRPGKTSYSMMGQDSNGNTMLGLGVDTSGYSSYLKVSAATLAYSNNGSSESRIYHEGFKPSLGELGGIASTGGTMTGTLFFGDNDKGILASGGDLQVVANSGTVNLMSKQNPVFRVNGTNYTAYHQGYKPTAADVGALPITGGTLTGQLRIRSNSSHIDLIEADNADKTWRIEGQNNNLDFTEAGVGIRLRLAAGGATLSGQLNVNGHIVGGAGTILKFPTANYTTGAQLYARDGGQYGANFVINSGGNLILGAGESGTAFADELGASTTEHAYLTADGDAHLLSNCNTIADRKAMKFGADGVLTVNTGTTTAKLALGNNNSVVSRIGAKTYIAALDAGGTVVLESPGNPVYRNGVGAEYNIYHEGYKPDIASLGAYPITGGTLQGAMNTKNMKSAITVMDQSSIRYSDGQAIWFHNLAYGDSLRWATGGDSSQNNIMTLNPHGTLSLAGGLDLNNGITIKGTGNVMALAGGFLRSNTDSVMAMDGKVYSFVTSPRDAHLCANAYWDGANWYKYDSSKASMYAVVNSEGQFRLYGSSATSGSPQELSALVVDRGGSTSVGGNLTSNGQLHVGGGYAQINAGVNPMIEFHKPGVSASAIYVDGSNFLRFIQSNGSAGEAAHYFSAHSDGLLTPRKYTSTMNANRAWSSTGHAAFYNDSGETMGDGTYHGLAAMYSVYPGIYANELSVGYFCANSQWNQGSSTLSNYNASTGEIFRWMFRNNGTLEPSHGGWRMPADGNIVGNAWQGGNLGDFLSRNYAPLSDGNLKTVLGESKTSALELVGKMKFHEYVWNDEKLAKKSVKVNKIGVIAQELEEIDANFTRDIGTYDEEGKEVSSVKSLDTANLLAVALKAIQELQAEVADLKEKLNELV